MVILPAQQTFMLYYPPEDLMKIEEVSSTVEGLWLGRVVAVKEGIVYVDLKDPQGRRYETEIEEEKLKGTEIGDGDRFEMEIDTAQGKINFKKIPFQPVSTEQMAEIQRKLDEAFPDTLLFSEDDGACE